jgi:hypothetical protein
MLGGVIEEEDLIKLGDHLYLFCRILALVGYI